MVSVNLGRGRAQTVLSPLCHLGHKANQTGRCVESGIVTFFLEKSYKKCAQPPFISLKINSVIISVPSGLTRVATVFMQDDINLMNSYS
jgi:hypothetical protein